MADYRLLVRPQVEWDIADAMEWYRSRVPGLDQAFLASVVKALDELESSPEMFTRVRGEVRRAILQRFPYALFYVVQHRDVVVLACIHERRNPDRWPER